MPHEADLVHHLHMQGDEEKGLIVIPRGIDPNHLNIDHEPQEREHRQVQERERHQVREEERHQVQEEGLHQVREEGLHQAREEGQHQIKEKDPHPAPEEDHHHHRVPEDDHHQVQERGHHQGDLQLDAEALLEGLHHYHQSVKSLLLLEKSHPIHLRHPHLLQDLLPILLSLLLKMTQGKKESIQQKMRKVTQTKFLQ